MGQRFWRPWAFPVRGGAPPPPRACLPVSPACPHAFQLGPRATHPALAPEPHSLDLTGLRRSGVSMEQEVGQVVK